MEAIGPVVSAQRVKTDTTPPPKTHYVTIDPDPCKVAPPHVMCIMILYHVWCLPNMKSFGPVVFARRMAPDGRTDGRMDKVDS